MKKQLCFAFSFLVIQSSFASVPTAAHTFDTDIQIFNANTTQRSKIESAAELIKEVVGTEEFRDAVLNHTYNGKKTFVNNDGYTNEQIYQKILDGAEVLSPTKNNRMELEIETYYQSTSTVGYTYATSRRVYMNTKFLNSYVPAQVSRNMIHEWLHKLGFSHSSSYTSSRDYSVPYGVGSIMERLAKKIATPDSGEANDGPLTAATQLGLTTSGTQVTLKWAAAKSGAGIREYRVYRILEGSSTAYVQDTVSTLSFTQSAPSKNAQYYVKAVDNDGDTINSSKLSYTKPAALTAPTQVKLSSTSSKVTLTWAQATSTSGIRQYKIYRRLSGSSTIYLQGTTTGLSFSQSSPSRSAIYYVRAEDLKGATAKSAEVSFNK